MLIEAARIHAVVVCFHPDPDRLSELVRRLLHQCLGVVIVDNTPAGEGEVTRCMPADWLQQDGLKLLPQGCNLGIATGFNLGIRAAREAGASHVLLSDQDSLPALDMVPHLLAAERRLRSQGVSPGAIGPGFSNAVDRRPFRFQVFSLGGWRCRQVMADADRPIFEVGALISSGSLIRLDVLASVGGMRDELFIDYVDVEWCQRARSKGHPSYVCSGAGLEHRLGDAPLRVWAGGWRTLAGHGPRRLYFQARNAVYLMGLPYIAPAYRLARPGVLLGLFYAHGGFSNRRADALRMLVRGLWDGVRGRLGGLPD